MVNDLQDINAAVREHSYWISLLRDEIGRAVIGQRYMIDRFIVGLLTNGHILIEGVPGIGKTLTVNALAKTIQAEFKRIQFTVDLLPADILGSLIFNQKTLEFSTKKGPIFANIVLADEINRASARVQSALIESMGEGQVTIGDTSFQLPNPFMVLATKNPIDHDGVYELPESQVDRFIMKLRVQYPSKLEELRVLHTHQSITGAVAIRPIITVEQILESRKIVDRIYIDERVMEYIVDIVHSTRNPEHRFGLDGIVENGASPRATLALSKCSRAWAFLQGRGYVTPQDVKDIGLDVLRHRIIPTYRGIADGFTSEEVAKRILNSVRIP
ncbi:MAG: MoxR family ATPase [Puniceicoccales bacterium]|jgi:MoxR-like ATPase|nr:MoxR family ATPase [Puniceicoccales bacterium]